MVKKIIVIVLLVAVVGYIAVILARLTERISIGTKLAEATRPFDRVREGASLRFLVIGDSTAMGVGASDPLESTAGRLAADFPAAAIENISGNGYRLHHVVDLIQQPRFRPGDDPFDLILIQLGGNDIIRFTDRADLRADLRTILGWAEVYGENTLILHSGNIGLAPFFPWPLGPVLTDRTRQVRQIYLEEAPQFSGVYYVDLFTEKEEDPFAPNLATYYAEDMLHLSGEGYGVWYEKIRETMDNAGISF